MINISVVLYNNPFKEIEGLLSSFKCHHSYDDINQIYLIDNSPSDRLKTFEKFSDKIVYYKSLTNIGYGGAHNIALKKTLENNVKYHVVVNPDIRFDEDVLSKISDYMNSNPDVGLLMPKVYYPDGRIQKLCRLLPDPIYLIVRRVLGNTIANKIFPQNDLTSFDYHHKIANVPCLSGCFMFLRLESLKVVGLFDDRFFMYLEDFDLVRRLHAKYKTIYYPAATIYHDFKKGSYSNNRLLYYHVSSAIKYYNKYGWFFDEERTKFNQEFLQSILLSDKL